MEVTTFAGSGVKGFADGVGVSAHFNSPSGLAVDSTGTVYVADSFNHRIRKILPDGTVSTLAGSGSHGFSNGVGIDARFKFPKGVAVDSTGVVYVADSYNNRIRKILPDGTNRLRFKFGIESYPRYGSYINWGFRSETPPDTASPVPTLETAKD